MYWVIMPFVAIQFNALLLFQSYSCLPARSFAVNDLPCFSNEDCRREATKRVCVMPVTSKFNRFIRISHVQGQDILFVGNPYELLVYGR